MFFLKPLVRKLSFLKPFAAFKPSNIIRWRTIAHTPPAKVPAVFYGFDHLPGPNEPAYGGIVKCQHLQPYYPNSPRDFNILYMVSSRMPDDWWLLLKLARKRRAKIVWNQNGVAYPGWYGFGWQSLNWGMKVMLHEADHVFYQSEFCKLSSDKFLGERNHNWEILYNPVNSDGYWPNPDAIKKGPLVILLGGTQYQFYRLHIALRTVAVLKKLGFKVHLIVTGKLSWTRNEAKARYIADQLLKSLEIESNVEFTGPYTQQEAPYIMNRAHILLHSKYNDPCPGLVLEAMACGLPVVYSNSGGVPELVGQDAGIGIPQNISLDWEKDLPPDPILLAEAVLKITENYSKYSEAARIRVVEKFNLKNWVERHRALFNTLSQ